MQNGADGHAITKSGRTPLYYAAKGEHSGTVASLRSYGADIGPEHRAAFSKAKTVHIAVSQVRFPRSNLRNVGTWVGREPLRPPYREDASVVFLRSGIATVSDRTKADLTLRVFAWSRPIGAAYEGFSGECLETGCELWGHFQLEAKGLTPLTRKWKIVIQPPDKIPVESFSRKEGNVSVSVRVLDTAGPPFQDAYEKSGYRRMLEKIMEF